MRLATLFEHEDAAKVLSALSPLNFTVQNGMLNSPRLSGTFANLSSHCILGGDSITGPYQNWRAASRPTELV